MYSQVTMGMSVGLGPALDKRLPLLGSMTSLGGVGGVGGAINHGFVITESAFGEESSINTRQG